MKMPSTLTCICVFPPPHTLPHFFSLKKNKIKLVQRLQKKMENSKQLFWKEKKIKKHKRKELLTELSWQTSHPMHSRCAPTERRRRDWDSRLWCITQDRETFNPTLNPRGTGESRKKRKLLYLLAHWLHSRQLHSQVQPWDWHQATDCCSFWRLQPFCR